MTNQIYSKKLISDANSYGISVNELIMADLIAIGYTKMDAFYIAFPDYQSHSPLEARNIMESISRGEKFKALVKQRSSMHNRAQPILDPEDNELINKQQAAKEILRVAQSLPDGSKEKGEMYVKYMEMLRKNDESVDANNDHVNYYLPLTCHKCNLYKQFKDAEYAKEAARRKQEKQKSLPNS